MQTWRERAPRITLSCPASMQALSADHARLRYLFTLLPKSRLARQRVNRLPLFWAKLDFPRRHVFLQVRER